MICYRDRTFCISEGCKNECGRQLTKEDRKKADKMQLPIAVAKFCEKSVDTFNGKENKAVWLKVLVFGASGNNVLQHKKKGDRILVEGRIDYTNTETPELVIITDNVTFL